MRVLQQRDVSDDLGECSVGGDGCLTMLTLHSEPTRHVEWQLRHENVERLLVVDVVAGLSAEMDETITERLYLLIIIVSYVLI